MIPSVPDRGFRPTRGKITTNQVVVLNASCAAGSRFAQRNTLLIKTPGIAPACSQVSIQAHATQSTFLSGPKPAPAPSRSKLEWQSRTGGHPISARDPWKQTGPRSWLNWASRLDSTRTAPVRINARGSPRPASVAAPACLRGSRTRITFVCMSIWMGSCSR